MWLLVVLLLGFALRRYSDELETRRIYEELAASRRAEEEARKTKRNMYLSVLMYGLIMLGALCIFRHLCQNHSTSISTSLDTAVSNVARSNAAAVHALDAIATRHSGTITASITAASAQFDRAIGHTMRSSLDRLEDISRQHSGAITQGFESSVYRIQAGQLCGWVESEDEDDDDAVMPYEYGYSTAWRAERMARLQDQETDYELASAVASGANVAATLGAAALVGCCVM